MNILILGGTSDARKVVKGLYDGDQPSGRVIYSIAGLVRVPQLPCEVISGGFSQHGGLEAYLKAQQIDLLLDVTHPFAARMSATAVAAAQAVDIPCWRFHREAWQQQADDRWREFSDWPELLEASARYQSLLLTAGQLSQPVVDQLAGQAERSGQRQVLRTAAPPQAALPETMQWLKAIGPFRYDDEKQLLQQYQTDLLISKNSGGAATEAKLTAARELGIEVFMLQRPELPAPDRMYRDIESVVSAVQALIETENRTNRGL